MSNLTPTPRTDKNGVTSIRHMKPVGDTPVRSNIPTVRVMTERITARNFVKKKLLTMAAQTRFITEKEIDAAIKMMQEANPLLLPTAHRLMTTGTEKSMLDADGFFLRAAHDLAYEIRKMPTVGNRKWTNNKIPDALTGMMLNNLSMRSNALILWEELGHERSEWQDEESYLSWTNSTLSVAEFNVEKAAEPKDDWYWRGLGALALVQLATDHEIYYTQRERIAQVNGFIEYVGQHDDVSSVLEFAIARDLIDADALRSLTEQGESGTPSLSEGIL